MLKADKQHVPNHLKVDKEKLALRVVHLRNGHGPFCGTHMFPCPECEALHDQVMLEDASALLRELGVTPPPRPEEEADALGGELAHIYLTLIEPGRLGDLWHKPAWLADVAAIGDEVLSRAKLQALNTTDVPPKAHPPHKKPLRM